MKNGDKIHEILSVILAIKDKKKGLEKRTWNFTELKTELRKRSWRTFWLPSQDQITGLCHYMISEKIVEAYKPGVDVEGISIAMHDFLLLARNAFYTDKYKQTTVWTVLLSSLVIVNALASVALVVLSFLSDRDKNTLHEQEGYIMKQSVEIQKLKQQVQKLENELSLIQPSQSVK